MFWRKALQLELADRDRTIEKLRKTESSSLKIQSLQADQLTTLATDQREALKVQKEAWEETVRLLTAEHEADLKGLQERGDAELERALDGNIRALEELRGDLTAERQAMTHRLEATERSCRDWRDQCESLHAEKVMALHRISWDYCPKTDTYSIPSLDLTASLTKTGKWDLLDSRNAETQAKSATYRTVQLVAEFRQRERLEAALGVEELA